MMVTVLPIYGRGFHLESNREFGARMGEGGRREQFRVQD